MKNDPLNYGLKQTLLPALSLFTSFATLLCCALPALLVTLGAGAALAGLVSTAPWLVVLSQYKAWTFGISFVLIAIAGVALWNSKKLACPIDPAQALMCQRLRRLSYWVYWLSVCVWIIGFFFAFLAVSIFY